MFNWFKSRKEPKEVDRVAEFWSDLLSTRRPKELKFDSKAHELQAALGVMLTTWDNASEKLSIFLQEPNEHNAKEYEKELHKLFEAAAVGRTVYHKHK